MDKLLKQALAMSKTKLQNKKRHYQDMSVVERVDTHYKNKFEHYSDLVAQDLKALDTEYKKCFANKKISYTYKRILKAIDDHTHILKKNYRGYQRSQEGIKEWIETREKVLDIYSEETEAYDFLRNQMAIIKGTEDKYHKRYLYRNYEIGINKKGGGYFAYPDLNEPWHGFEVDMPKEFWTVKAETLNEIKYEIDQIIMKLFAIKTNLMEA